MSREEIMNDLQEPQEEDHELERFLSIMREYYKTHKFTGAVDKQAVLLYLKEILAEHGMIIHLPEEPTNQQPPLEPYENAISRASVEYICQKNTVSTNPYEHKYHDKFIQFMDDPEISDFGRWQHSNGFNTALVAVKCDLDKVPPMQPQQIKGRWIHDGYDIPHGVDWMHCSVCGRREPYVPAAMTNFCPDCGAWMSEESEPEHAMEEFMYEQDLGNPEDGSL